jgi:multicomponent Na+:H+ antiporter subunit D
MFSFLFVLFSPIIGLAFLPLKKQHRKLFYGASIILAVISIGLSFLCEINTKFVYEPFSFVIVVDKYSKIFLILISFTWLISIIYSYEFTKYHFEEKKTQFFLYLNILLTVVMINASAGNLVTLFVFYVIGIPLTHPLIKIRGNTEAVTSAKTFLVQTLLPSFLIFLPAIVITESLLGNGVLDGSITFGSAHVDLVLGGVVLAMFVVGISKNAVAPFHMWLPRTNTAPAPISGLIHSVGSVKTGSIALIKIAVYIFDLDYVHQLTSSFITGGWLLYLCGLTSIYTAYRALTTDDLKMRFAFSTVGQLSYIILAILVGSTTGIIAATLHIVTHGIAKSCLFYVAGFYNSVYKTVKVSEIAKIMPSTKFIALVIAVCGLSITGFPFLAGFYSKDMMLLEEWHSHHYSSAIFLLVGSAINIFYIIGPIKNAFKSESPDIQKKSIPLSMLITFIISMVLLMGSSFYLPYLTSILE